jgi:hypothetical protein
MEPLTYLSLRSWHEDFDFVLRQCGQGQNIDLLPRKLEDYLGVRYAPESIQAEVYHRLRLAYTWFRGNSEQLQDAHLMVAGETQSIVKNAVIFALFEVFGKTPAPILSRRFPQTA